MSQAKQGRRVSVAAYRLRRPKRDPSILGDLDEDGSGRPGRLKNAIYNDEIASLRIRDEDLDKISQEVRAASAAESPMPPTVAASEIRAVPRRVAVRREIPVGQRRPPLRRFVLLRRASPEDDDIAFQIDADDAIEAADDEEAAGSALWRPRIRSTPPGPRLDSRGNVVPHSLLGRPEEFYRIGLRRGHLRPEDLPLAYQSLAAAFNGERLDGGKSDAATSADRILGTSTAGVSRLGGSGVADWHRASSGSFALPALEIAEPTATSAREHNRRLLANSAFQMHRLTEQLDQCLPESVAASEQRRARQPVVGIQHRRNCRWNSCCRLCYGRPSNCPTGRTSVLVHRRLDLPEGSSVGLRQPLMSQ